MHVLILGGAPKPLGGVEVFCERASDAMQSRYPEWRVERMPTRTAFLTVRKVPAFIAGLDSLFEYRKQRPDCVWLQYTNLPDLVYLILARMLGLRVMVTPHLGSNWRSQSNSLLRGVSWWMLRFANRIALISRTQEVELALPANVPRSLIKTFLPHATLTGALPDIDRPNREIRLIHSGRLSEGKGTFLFVDVCQRLRDAGLSFQAQIVGGADSDTVARLREMIEHVKLGDHIMLRGHQSELDLLGLLRSSDILVHLSRIDSYPLIVLESMTCSVFPVCMELAGARDMIDTYGGHIVSQHGAVQETVDFISRLDINDVRHRGRDAARGVRTDYSWDQCASALETAVRLCVERDDASQTLSM